jgi:DNA-directed RNA polymerase subunit RPC12/RpoP
VVSDIVEVVCATCGRTADDAEVARLTWSYGVEGGEGQWTCDRCSREFLRSIEGRLAPEWW